MRHFPDFTWAVIVAILGLFSVLISLGRWPIYMRMLGVLLAIVATLFVLLYQEFSGEPIKDTIGRRLADWTCTIISLESCGAQREAADKKRRDRREAQRRVEAERREATEKERTDAIAKQEEARRKAMRSAEAVKKTAEAQLAEAKARARQEFAAKRAAEADAKRKAEDALHAKQKVEVEKGLRSKAEADLRREKEALINVEEEARRAEAERVRTREAWRAKEVTRVQDEQRKLFYATPFALQHVSAKWCHKGGALAVDISGLHLFWPNKNGSRLGYHEQFHDASFEDTSLTFYLIKRQGSTIIQTTHFRAVDRKFQQLEFARECAGSTQRCVLKNAVYERCS